MEIMFREATAFNGDLSNRDVSKVKDMGYMFYQASAFNQDLSGWCVNNITTNAYRFGISIRSASLNSTAGETPLVFGLDQNYPNPFNPSTTISYTLSEAGAVTTNVYNVMGQKVATLVDEMKTARNYTVRWDAADHASGMYYYRLKANDQVITKKMTLIK